jgi:guanylate cyclase
VWTQRISKAIDRFVNLGARPTDTADERAYKATHLFMSGVTALVVPMWSVVYASLGLRLAAAIPLLYTALTSVGLVVVARTRRIELFRASQLTLWLVLPFLLQWSVGGFANSGAVAMWAVGAPLLASLIGAIPRPWLFGFIGLSVVSGLIDGRLAAAAATIPPGLKTTFFIINFIGLVFVIYVSLGFFIRERERTRRALDLEREKSERLLLNILPARVAERLKAGETVIADRVDGVTILFADLVDSTPLSERLTPVQLVEVLDSVFTAFDDLADALGLEKIKTVGDAYMVVGGLPTARPDHAAAVAEMALAMRDELAHHSVDGFGPLQMRYGIDTGTVVAGVIGKRKLSYDLWGDTVNTASRMESHGVPGQIQVTTAVFEQLRERYRFESRGPVEIKGKGTMVTYLLLGKSSVARDPGS